MKHVKFTLLLLYCASCSDGRSKATLTEQEVTIPAGFIDTSYTFADSSKERVVISQTYSDDGSFQYVQFNYFQKAAGNWNLISSFDSLEIRDGFETDHKDFNGDGQKDFVFLAGTGGRGANYFQHLLLFDGSKRKFQCIKGSDKVCAPDFDTIKKTIVGTGKSGAFQDKRCYLVEGDSAVQKSGEIWEDGELIKRHQLINGKKITIKAASK